jgi:transcriptional antiterminator NusG
MKRWYVLQVYAGYEQAVRDDLIKRINGSDLVDKFGQVLVPSAKFKKVFQAVEEQDQQLFPGYVLIEMEMTPEAERFATSSLRVMRFLGGKNPMPLRQKEVEKMLSQIKGEVSVRSEVQEFAVGREVEIQEGPFTGFFGIVNSVDQENERLTLMVSIFGRMTPVELGFNQVKR